jgi:hypothetical protein
MGGVDESRYVSKIFAASNHLTAIPNFRNAVEVWYWFALTHSPSPKLGRGEPEPQDLAG